MGQGLRLEQWLIVTDSVNYLNGENERLSATKDAHNLLLLPYENKTNLFRIRHIAVKWLSGHQTESSAAAELHVQ